MLLSKPKSGCHRNLFVFSFYLLPPLPSALDFTAQTYSLGVGLKTNIKQKKQTNKKSKEHFTSPPPCLHLSESYLFFLFYSGAMALPYAYVKHRATMQ